MKRLLVLAALIMFLFAGCIANSAYTYPEGCEGQGIINNLPKGTDLATQGAIFVLATEKPEVKAELVNYLKEIKNVLKTSGYVTTTYFKYLIELTVNSINVKYEGVVIKYVPMASIILANPAFQVSNPLDKCDTDRLIFWIDSNLTNLGE